LKLMREHFGDEHPEVAVALFNLGNIHKDLGHLGIAKQHYRQALAIREAALREDHPLVIKNLTTLGKTLIASGERPQAMHLLERALDLSTGKNSQSTPEEVAALRFLLARVLWDSEPTADHERARSLAESAAVFYASSNIDYARESRTIDRWLAQRAP
ncbi:MAG TPA: tetratricopeptide repeat protein, partial [Nannocystis exedens]|nr:tetratricopeptide repeat protein [Nannocystis exedens]